MVEFISCTQRTQADFLSQSALGRSLQRLAFDNRVSASIAFENRNGLPMMYNQRLTAADSPEILIFVHDDVWLDDYFIVDRVCAGLEHFDILGVAGNRRRTPNQPIWSLVVSVAESKVIVDSPEYLSGAIAHGENPFGTVSSFGVCPADCQLLDGVFLAVRKSRLLERNVAFDGRFNFHFYDLDFCRTAIQNGLRVGTWPISMTHQSGGSIYSNQWYEQYDLYIEKWGS
jgi:Glycosyltransferase like family